MLQNKEINRVTKSFMWVMTPSPCHHHVYPLVIKHGHGKSTMNGGFYSKKTLINCPFSIAMFDYRRVKLVLLPHGQGDEGPSSFTSSQVVASKPRISGVSKKPMCIRMVLPKAAFRSRMLMPSWCSKPL